MGITFYLLLFLTIVTNIGVGLIIPIMPILMKQFGFSTHGLSLAFFILIISRFFSQNISGNLISKIGAYKVLAICFLLYIFTMFAYPFVETKELFIFFRSLEGIFQGLAIVCLQDLAIELSEKDRGKKMGYFNSAFGLGFIIGPSFGGVMFDAFGKTGMFWSAGVLSVIAFIGLLFAHNVLNLSYSIKDQKSSFFSNFSIENLNLLPYYGPLFIRRILFLSFQILLPLFLYEHLNVQEGKVGFYFTLSAIMTTSLMPLTGRVADKSSCRIILVCCLLLIGFSISAFGFVTNQLFFSIFYILETIGFCFMLPTGMKLFGDIINDSPNRGRIIGFFGGLTELCMIPVPFIFLNLYETNVIFPWMFLGALTIIISVPFWKKKAVIEEVEAAI